MKVPTRSGAILFAAKTWGLRLRKGCANLARPHERHPKREATRSLPLLADSISDLWTQTSDKEWNLTAGKVHNLRIAASHLDGLEVPAGGTFSFWAEVGRPSRAQGYAKGRELREGCLVPSVGGGLCQLSNALHDAAQRAGFEILERHAHSQVIPGSLAEQGRDATVFWNYLDLRFRSDKPFRIEARLDRDSLIVRLLGPAPDPGLSKKERPVLRKAPSLAIEGCDTCAVEACHQHLPIGETRAVRRQAFVLDAHWPEFDAYIQSTRTDADHLLVPMNGKAWGRARYAWATDGFHGIRQIPGLAIRRSLATRRLSGQGAGRQRALLDWDARIADALARRIPFDADHLVVSQNLLPFLWRCGAMGGRTFEVLLQRHPLSELQRLLDEAGELHPESPTLRDFRVEPAFQDLEGAALAQAQRVITPHLAIARIFGDRGRLLPWKASVPIARKGGGSVFFPAPTLGRKGAYEVREAMRGLDVDLMLGGPTLESPEFWKGFRTRTPRSLLDGLQEAAVVVMPAFVEHQPRILLRALASGIPVIATDACGIPAQAGLGIIPSGDGAALRKALHAALESS